MDSKPITFYRSVVVAAIATVFGWDKHIVHRKYAGQNSTAKWQE